MIPSNRSDVEQAFTPRETSEIIAALKTAIIERTKQPVCKIMNDQTISNYLGKDLSFDLKPEERELSVEQYSIKEQETVPSHIRKEIEKIVDKNWAPAISVFVNFFINRAEWLVDYLFKMNEIDIQYQRQESLTILNNLKRSIESLEKLRTGKIIPAVSAYKESAFVFNSNAFIDLLLAKDIREHSVVAIDELENISKGLNHLLEKNVTRQRFTTIFAKSLALAYRENFGQSPTTYDGGPFVTVYLKILEIAGIPMKSARSKAIDEAVQWVKDFDYSRPFAF